MENKCILGIKDLYFSDFQYRNKRLLEATKLKYYFDIETLQRENNEWEKKIVAQVLSKNGSFKLKLTLIGIFVLDKDEQDKAKNDYVLKYNTVAMMMPYIRSQISLLTTQPGIRPFIMPPYNVEDLVDEAEKK